MIKFTRVLFAASLLGSAFAASAQEGPITANVALATDYVFRGISQTEGSPAIQGGFDYEHEAGFYLGAWASSIKFADSIEVDYYGGFKLPVNELVTIDLGFTAYDYPGANDLGFLELRAGLEAGAFSGYVARSNDTFGSQGESYYYSANYDVTINEYLMLGFHAGYSWFDELRFGNKDNYTDYALALKGSVSGLGLSLTWTDTNLNRAQCGGSNDCNSALTLAVSKSF